MTSPTPYLHFPGTARDALRFYADVFGGELNLNTFADFGREDGPGSAIAHGELRGPVTLFAADAGSADPGAAGGDGEAALSAGADAEDGASPVSSSAPGPRMEGIMFSLLGAADPSVLRRWSARLASEGTVVDELQRRPWGASDGQVRDRYGLHWQIGFEHQQAGELAPATTASEETSSTDR